MKIFADKLNKLQAFNKNYKSSVKICRSLANKLPKFLKNIKGKIK
jgi:hypothetical protein